MGFNIELNNIFPENIHLKWGHYQSAKPKYYSVSPTTDSVVAHFCLSGYCITQGQEYMNMQRGKCVLFKEKSSEYLYEMGTDNNEGRFFEVSLNPQLYKSDEVKSGIQRNIWRNNFWISHPFTNETSKRTSA